MVLLQFSVWERLQGWSLFFIRHILLIVRYYLKIISIFDRKKKKLKRKEKKKQCKKKNTNQPLPKKPNNSKNKTTPKIKMPNTIKATKSNIKTLIGNVPIYLKCPI